MKNVKTLRNAHDIDHEITKLVKNSPKREAQFKYIRVDKEEEEDGHTKNLQRLCLTRWTGRGKPFLSVIDNYLNLMELWDWCVDNCQDGEQRARISGIIKQMEDFDFSSAYF